MDAFPEITVEGGGGIFYPKISVVDLDILVIKFRKTYFLNTREGGDQGLLR